MNFPSCNFKTETGLWALTWAQAFHRLRWKFINRFSRQISRRLETAQVTRVTGHQDQAPSGVSWSMTIWIPWEYCEVHEGHRSSPGAATSAAYPLISPSHRWNHLSLILAKKSIKSWDVFLVSHPSPATLYGSSSGTGMRGLLRISTGLSFFTESTRGCYWQTKSNRLAAEITWRNLWLEHIHGDDVDEHDPAGLLQDVGLILHKGHCGDALEEGETKMIISSWQRLILFIKTFQK